jgi:hypothetical protein
MTVGANCCVATDETTPDAIIAMTSAITNVVVEIPVLRNILFLSTVVMFV